MTTKTVTFLDGQASGYLAEADAADAPGMIVIQEWWGLVPHVQDVAQRFAAEGYHALAPDLYHGKSTVEAEEAQHLMEGLDWGRAVQEITAAVELLRQQGCAKVGAVGFCMGGALAVLAAAQAGVDAAVSFYGFPDAAQVDRPCPPTQIFFGEHEEFFDVAAARQWADSQGEDTALTIFAGAGHAFFNDTREDAYHGESARRAWDLTREHFRRHLH